MKFQCPYCSHFTTITDPNYFEHWEKVNIEKSDQGEVGIYFKLITCPNEDCNKLWLQVQLCKANKDEFFQWHKGKIVKEWQLLPESEAKVMPDYIPQAVREDYYEACRIRDLSAKASATLSRRCLQGMIRDFHGISKDTLKQEIDALEDIIDVDTWESIDAVRSVGNIGAHMEKDINVIVDVDPDEAQLLIGLIEQLIDDWYVQREKRKERTTQLKVLVKQKEQQKQAVGDKNRMEPGN